eukprot:scaffold8014_cov125-Isochrysis_galbana.AAC.3
MLFIQLTAVCCVGWRRRLSAGWSLPRPSPYRLSILAGQCTEKLKQERNNKGNPKKSKLRVSCKLARAVGGERGAEQTLGVAFEFEDEMDAIGIIGNASMVLCPAACVGWYAAADAGFGGRSGGGGGRARDSGGEGVACSSGVVRVSGKRAQRAVQLQALL